MAVVQGQAAALTVCGGRRHYRSFKTLMEAEEFAAWWNYRESPVSTTARNSYQTHQNP